MNEQVLQGPNLTYFIKDETIGSFLFNRCIQYGDNTCQIDGAINKSETYSSVKLRSVQVALQLQKRGITSKDVVAFCSSNTLDNTIPIIASAFLGAKVANFESSLSIRHIKQLISIVEPKVFFVEENALTLIEKSLSNAKFKCEIIVFGNSKKYTTFSTFVDDQKFEENFFPPEVDPSDVAIFLFSSGSTGLPKAVCHSHKTFLKIIEVACEIGLGDAPFHFTQFYWITSLIIMLCSFAFGSYRVFSQNITAENVFRIIETYKVATIFSVPNLTYTLTNFKKPSDYDISSVKLFAVGGTPIASPQLLKLRTLFKSSFVCKCYGLTEIGFSTAYLSKSDQQKALTNLATCGKPVAETKIKIIDLKNGKLLGPNLQGEICIWSPSLMVGYYKFDSSSSFDKEGFFKTGDIGYYDNDKFLYIVGRIKDTFKYKAWHIVPAIIESVLLEHPGIKEAVVFGLSCGEDGEIPAACLVLHKNYHLQEKDVDEFLKDKVVDLERLKGGVTFADALPKTPIGKILRNEVKNFVMQLKNIK